METHDALDRARCAIATGLQARSIKVFTLAKKYNLGLIFDVFNVFNTDTIRSWGTRVGYDWIIDNYLSTEGHDLYRIADPRQARIGIRFMFSKTQKGDGRGRTPSLFFVKI